MYPILSHLRCNIFPGASQHSLIASAGRSRRHRERFRVGEGLEKPSGAKYLFIGENNVTVLPIKFGFHTTAIPGVKRKQKAEEKAIKDKEKKGKNAPGADASAAAETEWPEDGEGQSIPNSADFGGDEDYFPEYDEAEDYELNNPEGWYSTDGTWHSYW